MSPELSFHHVDVFADQPFCGNGLIVFISERFPKDAIMAALTREVRQFESIFLAPAASPGTYRARIFTMNEELPFAGHPILGAAAVLHAQQDTTVQDSDWSFALGERAVPVRSSRSDAGFSVEMSQGCPTLQIRIERDALADVMEGLGLCSDDLHPQLAAAVVSTGLPYLILPLRDSTALASAEIVVADFETRLAHFGAKFVYVLDVQQREGRTWENNGSSEDSATGSAAGPVAAYLVDCGLAKTGELIKIRQGRFVNRPSHMVAKMGRESEITVCGDVVMIASGRFESSLLS